VVASEVRALSQRSAAAAKEIKTLIAASSSQVAAGVALVSRTGESLGSLAEQITRIERLVDGISTAARDQAGGLAQVSVAVGHMDQMTQQNAAMVEETTAAGRGLSDEAERLGGIVGRFRTSGGGGSKPAQVPAPRRPVPVAPARRAAVAGGGWEEF
jgi:methyl-accepting chemotaxis protein